MLENNRPAGLADALGQRGAARVVDVGDNDLRAFARQRGGARRADAGRAAGDIRHLVLNLAHRFPRFACTTIAHGAAALKPAARRGMTRAA
jgi:hypothetical protein